MYGNQRTMVTAAVAAGVLVAAGTSSVGQEPTAAAPKSAPFASSVAAYAMPNTLYRPIVLTASGWLSAGASGSDGFVVSGGSGGTDAVTFASGGCPLLLGCSQAPAGGGTASTGSPGGSTMFGTTLDEADLTAFATGDPASARSKNFAIGDATAATLLSPTPSPFQIGDGLIGSIIDYLNVDAKSGQVCGQH